MIGVADWICDLLMSRGALVEAESDGRIRAMLPSDVSAELGASEWLSLDLRGQAGGDDALEWMDRMERLLPAQPLLAGARIRPGQSPGAIDAAAVLGSQLAIQNGVCRVVEEYAAAATYLFFTFQYTVESDDRSSGITTVCLNADAGAMAATAEKFLLDIRESLEEDASVAAPEALARCYPAALQAARQIARAHAVPVEHNANRRLARDAERVESYYAGLLAQAEKRVSKRAGDAAAQDKERSRARAIEADRAAKLEDLRRKYALRVRTDLAALVAVRAPVRHIVLRFIRKKEERQHFLHWNPVLRNLDQPLCEHCADRAAPLFLCERVHLLCKACWAPCADCGRVFCRVCQKRCKCGSAAQ